jgi:hypothetical protein
VKVSIRGHDIPAATGTAMEHFLQGLTRGRKARCQSLG